MREQGANLEQLLGRELLAGEKASSTPGAHYLRGLIANGGLLVCLEKIFGVRHDLSRFQPIAAQFRCAYCEPSMIALEAIERKYPPRSLVCAPGISLPAREAPPEIPLSEACDRVATAVRRLAVPDTRVIILGCREQDAFMRTAFGKMHFVDDPEAPPFIDSRLLTTLNK